MTVCCRVNVLLFGIHKIQRCDERVAGSKMNVGVVGVRISRVGQ